MRDWNPENGAQHLDSLDTGSAQRSVLGRITGEVRTRGA